MSSGRGRALFPVRTRLDIATGGPRGRIAALLDGKTVADPESPGILWSYRLRDGQLHLGRKERGQVEECILEYAFGSGHHATTFVSVVDPEIPAILEHRLTYYTQDDTFRITPGHKMFPKPPGLTFHGKVLPLHEALRCFNCHSTAISARDDQRIDEETMIPNVSCERCHGPGGPTSRRRDGVLRVRTVAPLRSGPVVRKHPPDLVWGLPPPSVPGRARLDPARRHSWPVSNRSGSCSPGAMSRAAAPSVASLATTRTRGFPPTVSRTRRSVCPVTPVVVPAAAPASTSAQPAEHTRPAGTPCPVSPARPLRRMPHAPSRRGSKPALQRPLDPDPQGKRMKNEE